MKDKSYLIIGLYEDDGQRFADYYNARSPEEAEEAALEDHPGLIIAGVLVGRAKVVA